MDGGAARLESASAWRQALANLHVYKRGGERAVHKPLLTLLLLQRAAAGGTRVVPYGEIEKPLAKLLKEFGPPRARVHPEFPFWHLQSDGIWVVRGADAFPQKRGGSSPPVTALRDRRAEGEVPRQLWEAIAADDGLREELVDRVLDEFWPDTLHASIRTAIGLPTARRRSAGTRAARDPEFRRRILRAYEYRCAVCGYDGRLDDDLLALEAAHVRWHCEGGPDAVDNGLALCSFHHNAYDRGAFCLDPTHHVQISRALHGGEAVSQWLGRFAGAAILGPQSGDPPPAVGHLAWHRKQVFRGPARPAPATRP